LLAEPNWRVRPCPFEKTPTFQSAAEHRFGDSLLASAFGPLTVNPIERARGKSSSSMFEDFELRGEQYFARRSSEIKTDWYTSQR
jgi:hypothetical protein